MSRRREARWCWWACRWERRLSCVLRPAEEEEEELAWLVLRSREVEASQFVDGGGRGIKGWRSQLNTRSSRPNTDWTWNDAEAEAEEERSRVAARKEDRRCLRRLPVLAVDES